MNLKSFLLFMTIGTLLSWFGWFMILFFIDPSEAGILAFLLFYLTLLISVLGTATVLGFFARKMSLKQELAFEHVIVSFRQGLWISVVVTVSLYLQSKELLTWWNAVLLILALGLIEFFCLNYQIQQEKK